MQPKINNLKGKGFHTNPENINKNGRPRKFVCTLKDQGYKVSEINDTIQAMMSMNIDELKSVWDDENATILEKTVAAAMRKSLEKGSLYSLETLLTRVFGRPKDQAEIDLKSDSTIVVKFMPYNGNNITTTPQNADSDT